MCAVKNGAWSKSVGMIDFHPLTCVIQGAVCALAPNLVVHANGN